MTDDDVFEILNKLDDFDVPSDGTHPAWVWSADNNGILAFAKAIKYRVMQEADAAAARNEAVGYNENALVEAVEMLSKARELIDAYGRTDGNLHSDARRWLVDYGRLLDTCILKMHGVDIEKRAGTQQAIAYLFQRDDTNEFNVVMRQDLGAAEPDQTYAMVGPLYV